MFYYFFYYYDDDDDMKYITLFLVKRNQENRKFKFLFLLSFSPLFYYSYESVNINYFSIFVESVWKILNA